MSNQKLLDQIERTWSAFTASFAGLTPAQMEQPGAAGEWSIKDILTHVTVWEEESLKYLPAIAAGEKAPSYRRVYGGIDAFNAQMVAARAALPLDEVLRRLETTHRQLVEYVAAAPAGQFASGSRCRTRLGWDSHKHYPHHEETIRAWRAANGL